jgi:hypothetical protein
VTKFFDLPGIQIFDVGTWNGKEWSDEDLDEMVANFIELSAAGYDFPGKLGHGAQELLDREDLPAAAYIKRMYRMGTKLVADFTRVPEKVKTLLELQAYRTVSAEIYDKVQLLGKTYRNVVSAVAFLGGDIPAVGTLDDALALYNRASSLQPLGALRFSQLQGAHREFVSWNPKEEKVRQTKHAVGDETVDDEAATLEKDLAKLAERASMATKGRTGAPQFRAFLRETMAKLRAMTSSKKSNNTPTDMSLDEMREIVAVALRDQFGSGLDGYMPYPYELYTDYVIASKDGEFFKVTYAIGDDEAVTFGTPVEVEQVWQESKEPGENPADAASLNKAGTTGGKGTDMAITKNLATALGIPETADEPTVLKALEDLKAKASTDSAKFTALQEEVAKLRAESATRDATSAVDAAIAAHKLLPAKKDWALKFAARDLEGFKSTFGADAPEVLDTSEKGSATDAGEPKSEVATFRAKVADKVKADTREIDYGQKVTDAQRAVSVEEPELYAAIRTRR